MSWEALVASASHSLVVSSGVDDGARQEGLEAEVAEVVLFLVGGMTERKRVDSGENAKLL